MNVENESNVHKAKIVGFSVLMAVISGGYQWYYNNMTYRSGQLQAQALAGQREFNPYFSPNSRDIWMKKNTLAVLEAKSFKDLVYIENGWTDQVITTVKKYEFVTDDSTGESVDRSYDTSSPMNYGPQGNTEDYYTQTERFATFWADELEDSTEDSTPQSRVDRDAARYSEWETMHTNVIWFDTAGCSAPWVGSANEVKATATSNGDKSRTVGAYLTPTERDAKEAADLAEANRVAAA